MKHRLVRSLFWLLALVLLLVGCSSRPTYKKVRLSGDGSLPAGGAATGPTRLPLRVGVAAILSPRSTFQSYAKLLEYLGNKLGRPVELVQGSTYAEINELVRIGRVDLAFVCTRAYLEGQQDFGMELLVAPQVRGEIVYYSYLVVPAGSEDRSLTDLRGKTFAFSDPLSNSGHLVPLYQLRLIGERPETFFRKTLFTYSHDNSIKAVAEKLVDGAAVDSLVYDYLQARQPEAVAGTKVIQRFGPYGIPPVVVHPNLDARFKAQLRDLLLSMDENPDGRAILNELLIDRFVVVPDSLYDSVRDMMEAVR
ncbi:MAG TPA: phosphate/phosphite/phosphonate ABC transporter substrate-binding protein [Anaerolineae bacterium]|nr:phosphate/phosphite/phosphonate ABC transporter substrate-binding protein [Anaerolineae bacterium]